MWLGAGIGLFVLIAVIAIAVGTTLYLREAKSSLPPELRQRRRAIADRLARVAGEVPAEPALLGRELTVHPDGGSVEERLLAKQPRRALAEAERVLASAPNRSDAHLLLARALVAVGEPETALAEVERAVELGASGAVVSYLKARAGHLRRMRAANRGAEGVQESPVPTLITPYEMLVLKLEQQRRRSDKAAAIWLAGATDQTLDHDQIVTVVTEHFSAYYRDLELLLDAVGEAPGFAEALYHLARLALKAGFIEGGRDLFERIEPLMPETPEQFFYERDLAQLRDESEPVDWLPEAEPSTGRRVVKLKIIE